MKTVEIDDEIYEFLKKQAIPFEEPSPNCVIGRLLGIKKKVYQKEQLKTFLPKKENLSKVPKASLMELVQKGILKEGQKIFFNYKGQRLKKEYQAEIVKDKISYEGKLYAMSSLVAKILDNEGLGIPSRSYRGPEYWQTSDGITIRELWEQLQNSEQ